jgi:hypothetical protein
LPSWWRNKQGCAFRLPLWLRMPSNPFLNFENSVKWISTNNNIKKRCRRRENVSTVGTEVSIKSPSETVCHSHNLFLALDMSKCSAYWGLKGGVKKNTEERERVRKEKCRWTQNLTIRRVKR